MKISMLRSVSLLAFVACAFAASAAPIVYRFTGTGTGALNGSTFTNAFLTFTALGDTQNVFSGPGGYAFFVPVTATVSVSGVGSDALSQTLQVFSVPSLGTVGLGQNGPDVFDVSAPALAGYDLTTAIGPLPTSAFNGNTGFNGNPGRSFGTAAGSFRLDSIGAAGTFTASLQAVPGPVAALPFALLALKRRRAARKA